MIKPGAFRFLLAFLVVCYHITKFLFIGHFAVFCFFILSGYWIANMFEAKYSVNTTSYLPFYVSRLWRLLPVYILVNALAVFLYRCYHNDFLYTYTSDLNFPEKIGFFLSNIFILGFNLLPNQVLLPAWSLDVELQFYFLFPLIFPAIKNFKGRIEILFAAFAALIILITAFHPNSLLSKTLMFCFLYFLTGITIYLKKLTFSHRTEIISTVLFFLVLGIHYAVPALREQTLYANNSTYNAYLNEALPFLLVPLISNSVLVKSTSRDCLLGNMSYVLYLLHWALIIPYFHYTKDLTLTTKLFYSAAYLALTLTGSYLIYVYFDGPLNNLRKRWATNLQLS